MSLYNDKRFNEQEQIILLNTNAQIHKANINILKERDRLEYNNSRGLWLPIFRKEQIIQTGNKQMNSRIKSYPRLTDPNRCLENFPSNSYQIHIILNSTRKNFPG